MTASSSSKVTWAPSSASRPTIDRLICGTKDRSPHFEDPARSAVLAANVDAGRLARPTGGGTADAKHEGRSLRRTSPGLAPRSIARDRRPIDCRVLSEPAQLPGISRPCRSVSHSPDDRGGTDQHRSPEGAPRRRAEFFATSSTRYVASGSCTGTVAAPCGTVLDLDLAGRRRNGGDYRVLRICTELSSYPSDAQRLRATTLCAKTLRPIVVAPAARASCSARSMAWRP